MSDVDERLEEEIIHASRKSFDSQEAGMNANFLMELQSEIERLRADLAAVTKERDRMREAVKPLIEIEDYPDTILMKRIQLMKRIRDLRAALEGVTEKTGAGNEQMD